MSWLTRLFGSGASQGPARNNPAPTSPTQAPAKPVAAAQRMTSADPDIQQLFADVPSGAAFLEQALALPSARAASLTNLLLERHSEVVRPLLALRFNRTDGVKLSKGARSLVRSLVDAIWVKDPDGFAALTRDADPSIRRLAASVMSGAMTLSKPSAWVTGDELSRQQAIFEDIARRSVAALTESLKDADPDVRGSALSGLGSAGTMQPLALMLPLANDPEPSVRGWWLLAFHESKDPVVICLITKLASDSAPEVRKYAPSALRHHLDQASCLSAMRALSIDPSPDVRGAVAKQAGYSKEVVAGEMVEAMSSDADPAVRRNAVEALAQSSKDGHKAIFSRIAGRFWSSDESADAHRHVAGKLVPHNTHAGVAKFTRPGRRTSALEVSGTFQCIGGCNGVVSFTLPLAANAQQQVKCSCGLPNSLDITDQGGFIWMIARPLSRTRPLNPNVLRMGMTITSLRTAGAPLVSLARGEDLKIWVGDPQETMPLDPAENRAQDAGDTFEPSREVLLAAAMQHYDEGLRNLCKSQGNKSVMWYGQAIRDFTKAITIDSGMMQAYRARASCYAALKDSTNATADRELLTKLESAASRAQPVDRSAAQAAYREARKIMESGGLIAEALFHLQKAIDADRTFADAYDARSDVYATLGMADESIADIRRAGALKC